MDAQVVSFALPGKSPFFLLVSNLDAREEKNYDKTK